MKYLLKINKNIGWENQQIIPNCKVYASINAG